MEERRVFIVNIAYYAVIAALVFLIVKYLLPVMLPFILGFVFAYFAVKVSKKVFKKETKLSRMLSLLLIYLSIILINIILISSGFNKITTFIANMPTIYKQIVEPAIIALQKEVQTFVLSLPQDFVKTLSSSTDSIFQSLRQILSSGVGLLGSAATSLIANAPSFFISLILTIVSSFYIVLDYEGICSWLTTAFPSNVGAIILDIRDFFEQTLFKIIGSYVVIMAITYVELFIGFLILRIPNPGLWGFLIAIMDILPVLGVGTALIPWGITSLIIGNTGLGIGIIVLYLIITVIRNVIEPKLVGGNLGLHPLATLIAMITGLNIFGVVGMFGFPLALSFILSRNKKENKK